MATQTKTFFESGSIKPTLEIKFPGLTLETNYTTESFTTNTGSFESVTTNADNFKIIVDTPYTGTIPITITPVDTLVKFTDGSTYNLKDSYSIEVG